MKSTATTMPPVTRPAAVAGADDRGHYELLDTGERSGPRRTRFPPTRPNGTGVGSAVLESLGLHLPTASATGAVSALPLCRSHGGAAVAASDPRRSGID